jgi:hypothetical protein
MDRIDLENISKERLITLLSIHGNHTISCINSISSECSCGWNKMKCNIEAFNVKKVVRKPRYTERYKEELKMADRHYAEYSAAFRIPNRW